MRGLEKVNSPLDLFNRVKRRNLLNRDNLIYLQKALMTLGRMDLVHKAVQYARQVGNTLHFYPASEQPGLCFSCILKHFFCYTMGDCICFTYKIGPLHPSCCIVRNGIPAEQ